MGSSLKIRQLIFGEQRLMLVVQRREDGEHFQCSVLELYSNDKLLAGFGCADVRLISYFAALEECESDRRFLQKFNCSDVG